MYVSTPVTRLGRMSVKYVGFLQGRGVSRCSVGHSTVGGVPYRSERSDLKGNFVTTFVQKNLETFTYL